MARISERKEGLAGQDLVYFDLIGMFKNGSVCLFQVFREADAYAAARRALSL
jgi:hypothetical protein